MSNPYEDGYADGLADRQRGLILCDPDGMRYAPDDIEEALAYENGYHDAWWYGR
jgi:hypothetical protein